MSDRSKKLTPAASNDLRQLVQRCIHGQQDAMLELVDRFQGRVFGLCYRMLGQRQDAEDVLQETFIRVLKNLHRWEQDRAFEPWLFAIAGNRCRSALSARQRRPTHQTMLDPPEDGSRAERDAELLAEEVQLALQQIRPEYRQAFVLFHEQQLSYEEISEILERPMGTVKTWIHRSRTELIKHLRQREVIEEPSHALR